MQGNEITIGSFRGTGVGQGGFATVYRVTDTEGRVFALKLINPDADDLIRESLYHEFSVQSELIHPQVTHAHAFGVYQGRPYIVLDWVDGAELFERLATPSADDFALILRQLARVMLFVHHRNWVHGDLKPENLRWRTTSDTDSPDSEPQLCLLDFGLARQVGDADRPRGAGTVGYCAPEFLNSLPADGRADWYAVGIILYEWVFGVRPYAADEPAVEIGGHLEGAPDFNRPRQRPAPAWADEVIKRLLSKTAEERAEDEHALLLWLAQFDGTLDPSALLNDQLTWHARSAAMQLRGYEKDLLQIVEAELVSGESVQWSISSHGAPSEAWMNRVIALCSSMGYDVSVNLGPNGHWTMCDRTSASQSDARIDIRVSPNVTLGAGASTWNPRRSLTLLAWDRDEVRSHIRGVVGDDDVAEMWADTILESTCGLPQVVCELLQYQVDNRHITLDSDGWGIDEDAIRQWRDLHTPGQIADVFGPLTESEATLLEWLALGEGVGATTCMQRLWDSKFAGCDDVISDMEGRGFVVRNRHSQPDQFDLWLRLRGHDDIIRTQISQSEQKRRSQLLAAAIADSILAPEETRARVLGHALARAEEWDRSAEEFLRAASFSIAADDRDMALRFIVHAQNSAERITEEKLRRHWIGHTRMVEGDLQKAAGQLDVARQIYRELLGLCRQTDDHRLLAETLHDLGDLYRMMRRYDKGIRAERRARRIWEELGDRAELSRSLNSLGNLCRIARDFKGARAFFIEALKIQRELGLDKYAATNLNNIGLNSWEEYKFDEAESYFREALAIQERLNVPVEIARVLNNLGVIGFVQGQLDSAADYFSRAAELNASAGAQSEELYNHRNLVEVALELGDLRSAVSLGQQVYQLSQDLGDVSTSVEVAAVLADAYLRAGDYRSALRLHDETVRRAMSLKNDELRVYLELQRVATLAKFNRGEDARQHLDVVAPVGVELPSRYLGIEALILRLQMCSSLQQDEASLLELLDAGLQEADAIGATHKGAQIATAVLPAILDQSLRGGLVSRVTDLLTQSPRWHWAPDFHSWQARELVKTGQLDQALTLVTNSVERLRHDGCWEQLWRALVLQAEICHAQADYEPAMRALDEAAHMLKIVSSTVEDDKERLMYLDCAEARSLERIRDRITELVT